MGLFSSFKKFFKRLASILKAIADAIVNAINAIVNALVKIFKSIAQALGNVFKWLFDKLGNIGNWLLAIILTIALVALSFYTGVGWSYISTALNWIFGPNGLLAIENFFTTLSYSWSNWGFWDTIKFVGNQLTDAIVSSYNWISDAISTAYQWLSDTLGTAWDFLANLGSSIWSAIVSIGSSLADILKYVGGAVVDGIEWAAKMISDNPGLAALGLAAATGWLDKIIELLPFVAGGFVLYKLATNDEKEVVINAPNTQAV